MTDQMQAARNDLAFMKALADDKDPLPWIFGAHLLAPGVLYAPAALLAWAKASGVIDVPTSWVEWYWAPATVVFAFVWLALLQRGRGLSFGPNKRVFAASWSAMSAMTITVLLLLTIAGARSGSSLLPLLPPLLFVLYGGTWTVIGIVHGRLWHGLVALGCFATAIICASLLGSPTQWLAMGLGILLWIAAPGLVIITRARAAELA